MIRLLFTALMVLIANPLFAKTEDSTSIVPPVSAYGTYNGAILPLKVSADGTVVTNASTATGWTKSGTNVYLTTSTDNVGIGTSTPTHSLSLGNTSTGIAHYNTADVTTNYERVRQYFSGNIYNIDSEKGGTGTIRSITLGVAGNQQISVNNSAPYFKIAPNTTASTTNLIQFFSGSTGNAASGTQIGLNVMPIWNQTSTAGAIDLQINRGQTAVGTGTQAFLNMAISGTTQYLFKANGSVRYVPSATQSLSVGSATLVNAPQLKVQGNGSAVTITAAPSIADGVEGDFVCIQGQNSTNTVTYQDQGTLASSNLRLGATSRLLAARDSLCLQYDGADWVEVSFSNVL